MKYRPWVGCTVVLLAIPLDIFLGRTGLVFISAMFAMVYWSQYQRE